MLRYEGGIRMSLESYFISISLPCVCVCAYVCLSMSSLPAAVTYKVLQCSEWT